MLSHLSTGGTQEKSRGLSVSLSNTGNFIITVPVTQYHPFVLAPVSCSHRGLVIRNKKARGGGIGKWGGEEGKKKERKDRRKHSSESGKFHAAFRYFLAVSKFAGSALWQPTIHIHIHTYIHTIHDTIPRS